MKCLVCDVVKLSREFPREPLTENCTHPALCCLRCVVNKVTADGKCPHDGCDQVITPDNSYVKECKDTLEFLFPENPVQDDYFLPDPADGQMQTIQIATLTGENETFLFEETKYVNQLKMEIKDRMGIKIEKQRLVYNGQEVKSFSITGERNKLSDFGVKPRTTIHLMILLYAVPETLNHVVFDLSWKYPSHGRDFLDASCLMFMKDEWYNYIDWRNKGYQPVWHSGDNMDDHKCIGRHRIEAKLKEIPLCVSHLVFTLSSFKSPTIKAFGNPTLKFYDVNNTSSDLCTVSFEKVAASALIICCVSRMEDGNWHIDEGGLVSDGSAKTYHPLIKTIRGLINSNCFTGVSLEPGKSLITYMNDEQQRQYEIRCKKRLEIGYST